MNIKLHTPTTLKSGSGMKSFKQFLLSILATTVSIILTFGTAAIIDYHKKKAAKKEMTMMIISDFDKNIEITQEVVDYAHARGVVVESELGAIAGIEDDINVDDKYGAFTHPQDVVEFVSRTGIDSLAIAIGTAHGAYKFKPGQKPQLRFDILEEIQEKLPGFPLVLHGASSVPQDRLAIFNQYGGDLAQAIGIPGDMLRKAASMAVCKINVGTDIRVCWFGELRRQFAENPKKFDGRSFIGPAQKAVAEMVAARITDVFGSNGKA